MKNMYKVIAVMMIMAITTAMPAMAGNRNHVRNDKSKVVVVVKDKKHGHYDKTYKKVSHFDRHWNYGHRPYMKACTFRVSRHAAYHHAVARAERIHGVKEAYWNPRTREMTVIYDTRITSARHIMRLVA